MVYYNYDKLDSLKDGDILFFDELLNGNPVVLNACLTVLEQRKMISGKPLPDVMIVAAANPQGMTPLTPQIKERFIWYNVVFNEELWRNYMFDKYTMPYGISNMIIIDMIFKETFEKRNFWTPRTIEKWFNMILLDGEIPNEGDKLKRILENGTVDNPFNEDIELPDGSIIRKDQRFKWIDYYKLSINGNITK